MKKTYQIPTLEVLQAETEALLEASLTIIEEDATDDAMSRITNPTDFDVIKALGFEGF